MSKQKLVNDWLLDLRGYTMKEKILEDARKYIWEEKMKFLGYRPVISEFMVVAVHDKDGMITGIGGSVPSDLILDNWGEMLAATKPQVNVTSSFSARGQTSGFDSFKGGSFDVNIATFVNFGGAQGTTSPFVKVGGDATAPTRADFDTGTTFINLPESANALMSDGAYSVGGNSILNVATIGPTGGTGTIRETLYLMQWYTQIPAFLRNIACYHDLAAPVSAFVPGNFITIQYTTIT